MSRTLRQEVRAAVLEWIRDDAPSGIKMALLTRASTLVDRIVAIVERRIASERNLTS